MSATDPAIDLLKRLAKLHLDYEKLEPWELEFVETPGVPDSAPFLL